jgi:hypothetical protein
MRNLGGFSVSGRNYKGIATLLLQPSGPCAVVGAAPAAKLYVRIKFNAHIQLTVARNSPYEGC